MKRIISLMLMIAILLSCCAYAEEVFYLHNGTTFDMSFDEIKETEKNSGVELKEEINATSAFLTATDTIAGQPNSRLEYYFSNGKLKEMRYVFVSYGKKAQITAFDTIENGLIKKYGETEYSSITGASYPAVEGFSPFDNQRLSGSEQFIRLDYSQRLIKISDTQYVFIQHYVSEYRFSGYGLSGSNSSYTHKLVYEPVDAETAEMILKEMNSAMSDL